MLTKPQKVPEVFIARQPICDENLEIFAYELLFRNSEDNAADVDDGDQATSQVLVTAFMEIGLNRLVGDKPAFINLTHNFLTGKHSIPLAREKIFLEILEDIEVDKPLVDAVAELRKQGFKIALDDFVFEESKSPLIEECHIIKIDLLQTNRESLPALVDKLVPFGKELLAEKVETHEDYEFCKSLGFKYFQGYFFCKPKIVKYATLPPNNVLLLQILAKTQEPQVEFAELEEMISQDVGISYKLLRLINSAQFNLSRNVESLHQALVLLGMKEIKNWIALVSLSSIEDVPQQLTAMSMARAKFCKLLAEKASLNEPDTFFTIGMFSLIDVMMKQSLQELLKSLPFSAEVNKALMNHRGPMGEALDCAIACEQGDWSQIKFHELTEAEINDIYIDAVEWSHDLTKQLK